MEAFLHMPLALDSSIASIENIKKIWDWSSVVILSKPGPGSIFDSLFLFNVNAYFRIIL